MYPSRSQRKKRNDMSTTGFQKSGRIKILFPIYGLEGGGAERVITTLVNHLDRGVFEPVLVLLYSGGEYRTDVRPDVKVIKLYEKDASKEKGNGFAKPVFVPEGEKEGPVGGLMAEADTDRIDASPIGDRPPKGKRFFPDVTRIRKRIGNRLWAPRKKRLLTYSLEDLAVWMYILYHTKRLQSGFEKAIEEERPDVIVSNLLLANYLALQAGTKRGVYTAVCIHNTLKDYQVRVEFRRSPLQQANAIVTVSHAIGEVFRKKFGGEKVRVIHNPHDIQRIQQLAQEAVTDPWFATKELPLVVGMGRLCCQKNFSLLIEAVCSLNRNREIPVRLVLFGEGPEQNKLTRLIRRSGQQDRIKMMGWVPNPFRYLARADLFVLSSEWEGLPNTVIEAMACGVPVISTDCGGGPKEILRNDDDGLLVACRDKEGLKNAILRVLRDPHKAQVLRERGRERARAFDVSRKLPQYERLILEGVEWKRKRIKDESSPFQT